MSKPIIRVMVFPRDTRFLMIYAPQGGDINIDGMQPPFTKEEVEASFFQEECDLRIEEEHINHHIYALMERSKVEHKKEEEKMAAERKSLERQRFLERQAVNAAIAAESPSLLIRDRSALVAKKFALDSDITALTTELKALTQMRVLARGASVAPAEQAEQAARLKLQEMKREAAVLTVRIMEIKKEIKAENAEASKLENRKSDQQFLNAARQVLDRETYLKIWEKVRQIEEESSQKDRV